jgi:hypothetical protein
MVGVHHSGRALVASLKVLVLVCLEPRSVVRGKGTNPHVRYLGETRIVVFIRSNGADQRAEARPVFARVLSHGFGRLCVGDGHHMPAVPTVAHSTGELVVEFDGMATLLA